MSLEPIFSAGARGGASQLAEIQGHGIAYGVGKFVVLFGIATVPSETTSSEPSAVATGRITHTLAKHKAQVNAVCAVPSLSDAHFETEFLSGADDGEIIHWQRVGTQWEPKQSLSHHKGAIHSLACAWTAEGCFVASAGSDNRLVLWFRAGTSGGAFVVVQEVALGSAFVLAVALAVLPGTNQAILATGGDDCRVGIYKVSSSSLQRVALLQGHEGWVRALAFSSHPVSPSALVLASGSQDTYIRLWLIEPVSVDGSDNASTDRISQAAEVQLVQHTFDVTTTTAATAPSTTAAGTETAGAAAVTAASSQTSATSTTTTYKVKFDALLLGHDDIVYTVCWHPTLAGQPHPLLLSASMDKTLIIWRPDSESGVWIEHARVGEVGGNTLGFYSALFAHNGDFILAHGYQGASHVWGSHLPGTTKIDPTRTHWQPCPAVSGHFGAVTDLAWAATGSYLLSCSEDQTTRVYAPTRENSTCGPTPVAAAAAAVAVPTHADSLSTAITNTTTTTSSIAATGPWFELARPQVHGYNMQCLASVDPTLFVSGADEKVLRVFEAPTTFLDTFTNITGATLPVSARPALGASVPALGLSNKAVFPETLATSVIARADTNDRLENTVLPFAPAVLATPPLEEHLLQNTLWPETKKLYGHGYELLCVAANHAGTLVVSACHATKPEHAAIRVWATATWTELYELPGHTLSITQMEFSHDDAFLLSGSRDRSFQLYRRVTETDAAGVQGGLRYVPHCSLGKAHERIIWSVSWTLDDSLFLTASRDKSVKVWPAPALPPAPAAAAADGAGAGVDASATVVSPVQLVAYAATESVTAVASGPRLASAEGVRHIIAAGLETGTVLLLSLMLPAAGGVSPTLTLLFTVQPNASFVADVTRLCWQPTPAQPAANAPLPLLAASSRDAFVRIYSLRL